METLTKLSHEDPISLAYVQHNLKYAKNTIICKNNDSRVKILDITCNYRLDSFEHDRV